MKRLNLIIYLILGIFFIVGCSPTNKNDTTLKIAAAASLEHSFNDKLIPMFEEKNPGIKVEGTYDGSGKLQTQIEEGMNVDIFMSAAKKQMDELVEKDLVEKDTVVNLLENKIVLIGTSDNRDGIKNFKDIVKAKTIAIGDPKSVPVGQYSKEILEKLNVWNKIQDRISLGTNVTEVLNWVKEQSAEIGIVYETDTKNMKDIIILAKAPENSLEKVVYPVGMVKETENTDLARKFLTFLASEEAKKIFKENGFTPIY